MPVPLKNQSALNILMALGRQGLESILRASSYKSEEPHD